MIILKSKEDQYLVFVKKYVKWMADKHRPWRIFLSNNDDFFDLLFKIPKDKCKVTV